MRPLDYKVLTTLEEILNFRDELYNHTEFVFDLETTGLDRYADDFEIIGLGFSFRPGHGVYIAINSDDNSYTARLVLEAFSDILCNPNIGKIGHNIKFDMLACQVYGYEIQGVIFDTQIASYCLVSNTLSHNLDDISLRYFNLQKTKTKNLIPKKSKNNPNPNLGQVDVKTVGYYCCEDTDCTYRAYSLFKDMLATRPHASNLFYNIEMPVYLLTYDMEKVGAYIDQDRLQELSEEFNAKVTTHFNNIIEKLGRSIDINKAADLRQALYEELQVQDEVDIDIPTTEKTKVFKTDAATLKLLKSNEVVNDILIVKKYNKFISTFVDAYPKKYISPVTGCIHASFVTWLTATGRFACLSPNLQQVPSRDEDGRQIRQIFVSRWKDKGGKILAADYSQAELRILAHVSEDEELIRIYSTPGSDIHKEVISKVYNTPVDKVSDQQRAKGKTLNFGIVYGMGGTKLAKETGMTKKEALDFIDAYLDSFPGVKRFIRDSEIFLTANGYTETVFGRRRYAHDFKNLNNELDKLEHCEYEDRKEVQNKVWAAIRQGQNHTIQGTCADIIKLAMLKVHEQLKQQMLNSIIILQIHDEIVLDVYPGEEDIVKELVKTAFQSAVDFKIEMICDVKIADNWSAAH